MTGKSLIRRPKYVLSVINDEGTFFLQIMKGGLSVLLTIVILEAMQHTLDEWCQLHGIEILEQRSLEAQLGHQLGLVAEQMVAARAEAEALTFARFQRWKQ